MVCQKCFTGMDPEGNFAGKTIENDENGAVISTSTFLRLLLLILTKFLARIGSRWQSQTGKKENILKNCGDLANAFRLIFAFG